MKRKDYELLLFFLRFFTKVGKKRRTAGTATAKNGRRASNRPRAGLALLRLVASDPAEHPIVLASLTKLMIFRRHKLPSAAAAC